MDMGGPDSKRRPSGGGSGNLKVQQLSGAASEAGAAAAAAAARPLDKVHCDATVNCLLRLACQVNNAQAPTGVSPLELLSRSVHYYLNCRLIDLTLWQINDFLRELCITRQKNCISDQRTPPFQAMCVTS